MKIVQESQRLDYQKWNKKNTSIEWIEIMGIWGGERKYLKLGCLKSERVKVGKSERVCAHGVH